MARSTLPAQQTSRMVLWVRTVSPIHRRRLSPPNFTGSAGQAIVSKTSAYLITDSRYWLQAREQLDSTVRSQFRRQRQTLDRVGIVERANHSKVDFDAPLISYEKATALNHELKSKKSKLQYPPQNLVDLFWRDKPPWSKEPIFVHPQ